MAWVTLTTDDVQNYISGAEYDALTSAALGDGQTAEAIVEAVISDIVQTVRGYVQGCAKNTLGEGATIPQELRGAALILVRNAIFTRLPAMEALNSQSRQDEVRSAERRLSDVAACKFVIEQPATVSDQVVATSTAKVITSPDRVATRKTLSGLL